ncbi:acyltransferase [Herbaspirillum sp. RTI4]|uniref:LpxL/LpxP family acyltransferase n=1 Tax=Herbaspirillum sp. RTI4 TaxID=3048640 RepID=UPI002AB35727|nr:acyltransferase [Herbaspirillum sp. RTI4]MDY7578929.1 acyltransferase [Herbaspirillum sp. RTI4]MEA9982018.1 acyltransferase [Herbaspirillum sp. RTI4]
MKPRTRHWAQIDEVTFVAGMRLLFLIYRYGGKWPFRVLLYPVLGWYMLTNPAARKASKTYLDQLHAFAPDAPVATGLPGVLRHFAAFAESLLDKMLLWGGQLKLDDIRYIGQEAILDNIAQQRGGLLICAHLGNLELCRLAARLCPGLKMTVLVHTKHAQAFNRLLASLDPDSQLNLMQVTEITPFTALQLKEKVSRGEFVVIAGDRIPVSPGPRVAFADFLGKRAPFPVGPYVLASVLECPVYLMFSQRLPTGAEFHFELFCEQLLLPRKNRTLLLDVMVADYAARLTHHCLRTPLQWFNFYDFWVLPDTGDHHAPH